MIEKIRLEDGEILTVILCDSGSCEQGIEKLFPLGNGVWEESTPRKRDLFTVLKGQVTPEELGWQRRDWGWQCPKCNQIEKQLDEGVLFSGASVPESEE